MSRQPRVAITGLGAISCLGNSDGEISAALRAGRSGIGIDPLRVEAGFRSPLTGKPSGYDARAHASKKQLKSMGEPAQYALGAAVRALGYAGLSEDALRDNGAGLIVGNDSTVLASVEAVDNARQNRSTRLIGSGAIIQTMASTVSMNLSTFFGVRGASFSVSAACASSAHAIGQAYVLIKAGLQDLVLCGGAQETAWQAMVSFDAIDAFARLGPDGDPTTACRPFDADRRGLVPSGGAAMLVLERLDRAVERGAPILGELVGYGFSSDGSHLTQPAGEGAVRAMREALRQGKRQPVEVDYINAHATGTLAGDVVEGRALLEVFGGAGKTPPVSSTKSMTGHECWMAGASELTYSLLMMRDGFLAPTRNCTRLAPELAGLDVVLETRAQKPRLVLSNSFGFGGTNAALLVSAFDGNQDGGRR